MIDVGRFDATFGTSDANTAVGVALQPADANTFMRIDASNQRLIVSSNTVGINTVLAQNGTWDGYSIAVAGDQIVTGRLEVTDISVTGDAHIENLIAESLNVNSLVLPGNLDVGGVATFSNTVLALDDISVGGTAHFISNVFVGENATFSNSISVVGSATFQNIVTIDQGLNVGTAATFSNNLTVLGAINTNGTATFSNTLTAEQILNVGGAATFSNTTTTNGAATFNNTATFASNVNMDNQLLVDTSLVVGGIGFFQSNVNISGDIIIDSNLTVGGTSTLSNLIVEGTLTLCNAFEATEISAGLGIFDRIYVQSNSTFQSNVEFNGLVEFTDGTIIPQISGDIATFTTGVIGGDISGDLGLFGDVYIQSNATFQSNLTANGLANFTGGTIIPQISGDIATFTTGVIGGDISGDFGLFGDVYIQSNLIVDGDTTLSNLVVEGTLSLCNAFEVTEISAGLGIFNDLYVQGYSIFQDICAADVSTVNLSVRGAMDVEGVATFNNDINGSQIFAQNLAVAFGTTTQDLTVQGTLTLTNPLSLATISAELGIFDRIYVQSNSTFDSNVEFNGLAEFNNGLIASEVSGAVGLFDDLVVHGDICGGSVLIETLDVTGLTTLSNLIVEGTLTLCNAFEATEISAGLGIFDRIYVQSNSTFQSNVEFNGLAEFTGGSIIQQISGDVATFTTGLIAGEVSGALGIFDNLVVNGDMCGGSILIETLDVTGLTTLSNLVVEGTLSLCNAIEVNEISAGLGIFNDLYVQGYSIFQDICAADVSTVNLSVRGAMDVEGVATFNDDINGSQIFAQNLAVAFGTTLQDLTVQGTLTLTNPLELTTISAELGIFDRIYVQSNSTFNSNVEFNGLTTFAGGSIIPQISGDVATFTTGLIAGEVSGVLGIFDNLVVNGDMCGGSILIETLDVTGLTTLSNLVVEGTLSLCNAFEATEISAALGIFDRIYVQSNSTFQSNVEFNGLAEFGGGTIIPQISGDIATFTTGVIGGDISGDLGLFGELYVQSNATFLAPTLISNTLNVTGATIVSNTLGVTGAGTFSNELTVGAHATFNSNAFFSNTVKFLSNVDVSATAYFQSNVIISGQLWCEDLSAIGNLTVGGDFNVRGTAFFEGGLEVGEIGGNAIFEADLSGIYVRNIADNNVELARITRETASGMVVFTTATFASNVQMQQNVFISGDIVVGGDLFLDNLTLDNLTVTSNTLLNVLNVTGATVVSNTLGVTGATIISNTLGVTNAATFSNNLTVTNGSTFSNASIIQDGDVLFSRGSNTTGSLWLQTNLTTVSGVTVDILSQNLKTYASANITNIAGGEILHHANTLVDLSAADVLQRSYNMTHRIQNGSYSVLNNIGTGIEITSNLGYVNVLGDLRIGGNIITDGSVFQVNVETMTVSDNFITLNANTNVGNFDSGIIFRDVNDRTAPNNNAVFFFDHQFDKFYMAHFTDASFAEFLTLPKDINIFDNGRDQTYWVPLRCGDLEANSLSLNSDQRLKKDIVSIETPLEYIRRLRGVRYRWKSDEAPDIGLIAQELETVFPELVRTDKRTDLKTVDYPKLVAVLIEALKEIDISMNRVISERDTLIDEVKSLREDVDTLMNAMGMRR